jgi:hypothetical protein
MQMPNRNWLQEVFEQDGHGFLKLTSMTTRIVYKYIFDAEYVDFVKAHTWRSVNGYALSWDGRKRTIKLEWMYFTDEQRQGREVDHISRNTFDCRSSNVRVVHRRVNNLNKSNSAQYSNIQGTHNGWNVRVAFNKEIVYRPSFNYKLSDSLDRALLCVRLYSVIAEVFDSGLTPKPFRSQLRFIADVLRDVDDIREVDSESILQQALTIPDKNIKRRQSYIPRRIPSSENLPVVRLQIV